ncbi:MAG: hypothetical protein OEZ59_02460 [Deltaproteobacteria bacterium]|nr:hypothetical protein [Deltaproteobacteria bacterium]
MDDRREIVKGLFGALTAKKLSRNKNFASFSDKWSRKVHRRFQVVSSLLRDAGRLAGLEGTACWISSGEDSVRFHLDSPRLYYSRVVALQHHEWEWLAGHSEIQNLLQVKPQKAICEL